MSTKWEMNPPGRARGEALGIGYPNATLAAFQYRETGRLGNQEG